MSWIHIILHITHVHMYTCRYIMGICIRADILWADILWAYVYVHIYIMGRYITRNDIFNAPEVGLSLTIRPYLIQLTRHCSHHSYHCSTLHNE